MLDRLTRTLIVVSLGWATWACVEAAPNLRPEFAGKDEAPIIGRVEVVANGDRITASCSALFTDAASNIKARVALDDSGWIVIAVPRGKTYLSAIVCFGEQDTFATQELAFDASGPRELAYFGHLHVDMWPENFWVRLARAHVYGLPGGWIVSAIVGNAKAPKPVARLEENFDEAIERFGSLYPASSATIRPFIALRASSLRVSQPLSEHGIVRAVTDLDGVRLHWLALPERDAQHVTLRVEHEVTKAELGNCRELRVAIDGQEARTFRLSHQTARRESMNVLESVQAELNLSLVQALASAEHASLDLCTLHRDFTATAGSSIHDLLRKFVTTPRSEHVPEAISTSASTQPAGGATATQPIAAP